MSLREEIDDILLSLRYENKLSSLEIIDKIISKIEKRIDDMMVRPLQQVKFAREYNGIDEDADMRLRVLNEVKEMLK